MFCNNIISVNLNWLLTGIDYHKHLILREIDAVRDACPFELGFADSFSVAAAFVAVVNEELIDVV